MSGYVGGSAALREPELRARSAPEAKVQLRVLLLWHAFGHDNLGIDALARASTDLIRRAASRAGRSPEFVTVGFGMRGDRCLPSDVTIGPKPSFRSILLGRSDLVAELRHSDLAVDISEGDSFSDIYGMRRFAYHWLTKMVALVVDCPLVIAPQTIGPFENPAAKILAALVLKRARRVFTRDDLSTEYLRQLGVGDVRPPSVDVAFGLPFNCAERTDKRIRVGIGVSGLLFNRGYTGANEFKLALDYAEMTRQLVSYFLSVPEVDVFAFGHVRGGGTRDDDDAAIAILRAEFPSLRAMTGFATAVEAKSWMSSLDFIVSGRMHACIGAHSAGVPVVPIAYSRKFEGVFHSIGYHHVVDGRSNSTAAAVAAVKSAFGRRETIKQEIASQSERISRVLTDYEDQLVDIIRSLPAGRASSMGR